MKTRLKKASYFLYLLLAAVFLLEICFRFQLVDFYANEWELLNTDRKAGKTKVLVGGDSFSATQNSYVAQLRQLHPTWVIANAAVPGTGPVEAGILLPQRIQSEQPDLFIYQLYVGNDLLDIDHPVNWKELGWARNVYWSMTDYVRSMGFVNYRLGQFRRSFYDDAPTEGNPQLTNTFSPEKYYKRAQLLFQAEPQLIDNSALLQNGREISFQTVQSEVEDLIECLPENTPVIILVIPHCAQVNEQYQQNMTALGAKINNSTDLLQVHYPFVEELEKKFAEQPLIHIANPLATLRKADWEQGAVYYANDPHLSPLGQEIIATFLSRKLNVILDGKIPLAGTKN